MPSAPSAENSGHARMTLWDRLTLATRYEAMLPDSIEMVNQHMIALDNILVMAEEKPNANHLVALKSFLTRMSASDDSRRSEIAQRILEYGNHRG